MKWNLLLLAFASLLTIGRANAEETAFDKFLAPNSPECVPVAAIEAAAKNYRPVSQDTYRFIQALYVATPPISRELPPGDKAELATDGNHVLAFLTDGLQTCARFLIPDFLVQIIKQVEGGKSSHSGAGI
jgi:hypothetical protein